MVKRGEDSGGYDTMGLSSPELYRWLEQQDDGWKELPDDAAFAAITKPRKAKKQIGNKLKNLIKRALRRKKRYAPTAG